MLSRLLSKARTQGNAQRRKAHRYETPGLPAFNFGEVVDISATGMRVRRPGKPLVSAGATEKFTLVAGFGPIQLRGKVAWVKPPGLFRRSHSYGVRFLNVDAPLKERLEHIGRYGFDNGPVPESLEDRARRKVLAAVEIEDLYPILGVSPDAGDSEIAQAYRNLVRRWHPDVCKEPEAEEQLSRVTKAYKILRDRELRRRYDDMRAGAAAITPGRTTPSSRAA